MTFLCVQSFQLFFLCPFLSSPLRLFPLQFPFVSKRSGNFLLFVNARMWWSSREWERKKGSNFWVYMVCYATYMKPNLIKLIAFFSSTSLLTTCAEGFHLRVSVSHWTKKNQLWKFYFLEAQNDMRLAIYFSIECFLRTQKGFFFY